MYFEDFSYMYMNSVLSFQPKSQLQMSLNPLEPVLQTVNSIAMQVEVLDGEYTAWKCVNNILGYGWSEI